MTKKKKKNRKPLPIASCPECWTAYTSPQARELERTERIGSLPELRGIEHRVCARCGHTMAIASALLVQPSKPARRPWLGVAALVALVLVAWLAWAWRAV